MNGNDGRAEEAVLVEAVLSPRRARDASGRLGPPPEWWDLPPETLEAVYRAQLGARALERALDPRGRSGTAHAVMARIMGLE